MIILFILMSSRMRWLLMQCKFCCFGLKAKTLPTIRTTRVLQATNPSPPSSRQQSSRVQMRVCKTQQVIGRWTSTGAWRRRWRSQKGSTATFASSQQLKLHFCRVTWPGSIEYKIKSGKIIQKWLRQHGQHKAMVENSLKQGGGSSKQNSVCPSELAKMFWTNCKYYPWKLVHTMYKSIDGIWIWICIRIAKMKSCASHVFKSYYCSLLERITLKGFGRMVRPGQ